MTEKTRKRENKTFLLKKLFRSKTPNCRTASAAISALAMAQPMHELTRRQRGRERVQVKAGRIHEDFLNIKPSFGVGEGSRGIPTLRWDNTVSREMFAMRGDGDHSGENYDNDSIDSLNSNYRVTITPLPKIHAGNKGLVSIVSADTHLALNKVKHSRDGRPVTQSALAYNSAVDSHGDRRRIRRKPLDLEAKERTKHTEAEIRDADVEKWLLARNKFPEVRWTVKQKRALRKWFDHLDDDKSGEVDVDELADPLLSTGIAKTLTEVKELIRRVDKDDSGEIGFEEFLKVMQPKPKNLSASAPTRLKKKMAGGLSDNNPIAQLQKIQQDNGGVDLNVVVAMQRRKFLMNAIVGEMKRREVKLANISEMEAEAKTLRGKVKFKMLHDIKTAQRTINKSFNQKQMFVSSMKGRIEASKQASMTALEKYQDQIDKDNSRNLTLTEAIDRFAADFDLGTLKLNQKKRKGVAVVEETKKEEEMMRGIASRGSGMRGVGASWYEKSQLKMPALVDEKSRRKTRLKAVRRGVLS